jgi:hypothetical protein
MYGVSIEIPKERGILEDLGVDGRRIIEWILKI